MVGVLVIGPGDLFAPELKLLGELTDAEKSELRALASAAERRAREIPENESTIG